jgi:hypothetical protein
MAKANKTVLQIRLPYQAASATPPEANLWKLKFERLNDKFSCG